MRSRFMRGTYLPTLNIIASSKNSDQSFLDDYIETKKKNESKTTLIVDEPQWVVDSRKDSKIHFWVAVGNKFLSNELLPKDAPKLLVDEYRAKGYSMLEVPIGYWENFQDNIDGALTDIAGIATASSLKYISGMRWNEIKDEKFQNPFTKEIITVGNAKDDAIQYSEFFDLNKVPVSLKSRPLYIHLDMSMSGDKTGIAGIWITGKRPKVEGESASKELYYQVAFSVAIKAPKGAEISFDKHRTFIRWLKEQGFAIKGISSDTFQSAQIQQQLTADGFNVSVISVDRLDHDTKTQLQYAYLKSTIYERRLTVYKDCDFLTEEVLGLERLSDGHIQHPDAGRSGCFTGDTKISLVDGRELSLLALVDEYNSGKQNYVYSFNETTKKIEPKLIEKAWCTRKNAELVEVVLDNGEILKCTPDHRFMLRDGSYCEAQQLKENDSLMPLYRKYPTEVVSMKNYRMYYEPIEDAWHYEHRQFAQEVLDEKYLVHHKNCNPHDNTPTNLVWCSRNKHQQIHYELSTGSWKPEARAKRSTSLSEYYTHKDNPNFIARNEHIRQTLLAKTPTEIRLQKELEKENRKIKFEQGKINAQLKLKAKSTKIREIEKLFNISWDNLSSNEKNSYSVKYARYCDPTIQERMTAATIKEHAEGKYTNAYKALAKCNQESKKLKELCPTIDKQKFFEIFGIEYDNIPSNKKASWVTKYRKIVCKDILNHKVISVKKLDYVEDVYDLTIQDNHNFALTAGIFVHNSKDTIDAICGALWNASLHADEFAFEYGEELNAVVMASGSSDQITKQQLTLDFEEELKKITDPFYNKNTSNCSEDNTFIDFGMGKAKVLDMNYLSQGIIIH